jgi:hypothetical protein
MGITVGGVMTVVTARSQERRRERKECVRARETERETETGGAAQRSRLQPQIRSFRSRSAVARRGRGPLSAIQCMPHALRLQINSRYSMRDYSLVQALLSSHVPICIAQPAQSNIVFSPPARAPSAASTRRALDAVVDGSVLVLLDGWEERVQSLLLAGCALLDKRIGRGTGGSL